jgi:hypothetical protein
MKRHFTGLLLFGGAVMAPLFAAGHGMEFLVAKLEVRPALVRLEITADYAGHPMLTDEEAAREAIRTVLRVDERPLEALAPLKFERRRQWDPQTPAAFAPAEGQAHELLTGVWQWQTEGGELKFEVPKGSANDVLLWTLRPDGEAKWMMLIAGDQSPPVVIPAATSPNKLWLWIGPLALVSCLLLVRRRRAGCGGGASG